MPERSDTPFSGILPLARAYILALAVCAPALAAGLTAFAGGAPLDPIALAVCVAAGAAANVFETLAPGQYSFQPNLVFFFWGAVLLPPWAILVLAVACFLPTILSRRLPWYKSVFNVASHAIPGLAAHFVVTAGQALPAAPGAGLHTVGVVAGAAVAFVALNYLLLVLVISTTAHIAPQRALGSVAEGIPLDVGLAITGGALAALWSASPPLVALAAGPMALIYHALRVPMLTHQAETDPKTGLFNFPYLRERLSDALAAGRGDLPVSVVMIDMDNLRLINNSLGHLAGDRAIQATADVIRAVAEPRRGVAARFGGEEFCLVLPGVDAAEGRRLAEEVRARVEALRFDQEGLADLRVTISAGVAAHPDHADSDEALLDLADRAVYDAKLGGRNRVRAAMAAGARRLLDESAAEGRGTASAPEKLAEPRADRGGEQDGAAAEDLVHQASPNGDGSTDARVAAPGPLPASPRARFDAPSAPIAERRGTRPARALWALAALVTAGAVAIGLMSSAGAIVAAPALAALLIGSVLLLDLADLDLFGRGRLSLAAVPILALAWLFGPLGPLAAEALVGLTRVAARRERRPVKLVFNFGALSLSGAAAATVFALLPTTGAVALAVAALAGLAHYAVSSLLVGMVWSLDEGLRPIGAWRERLASSWPHALAYGVLAGAFVLSQRAIGAYAFAVFALPILMLWVAERQYVERSRASVDELHRDHRELSAANEHLRRLLATNVDLLQHLHGSYLSTITSLARTIEAKDPYTGGHTGRVARIAVMLASELGYREADLRAIEVGATVHDIGKIGVPDAVLLKRGPLSPDELAAMRGHVQTSSYILGELELPSIVKQMVRSHHERFDGSGYPDRLRGPEIPLPARILAVADALDAMTSDRPYRRALAPGEARAEIDGATGTQFCPTVVAALDACLARNAELSDLWSLEDTRRPAGVTA